MAKKKTGWFEEKDAEEDTDRSLFDRLVEGVIVFAICCFLLRWGVEQVLLIRLPLAIIAVIAGTIVIIWRWFRWKDRHDDY